MYYDILSELSIDNVWNHILKLTEIAPEKVVHEASRLSATYDPMGKNHEEKLNRINKTFLRLCRVLSPKLRTISGKYSQDSYGLSALSKMIPSLFPIEEMSKWPTLFWTRHYQDSPRGLPQI